jgi:hypothetical protein
VSAPAPLSPVVELLFTRFGWDDLGRRHHDPAQREPSAAYLRDHPPAVGGDLAQRVDLIVMFADGKCSDFGKVIGRANRASLVHGRRIVGSETVTRSPDDPDAALESEIWPPCARTVSWAIDSPSPVPPLSQLSEVSSL